jgi:hypothetical protein
MSRRHIVAEMEEMGLSLKKDYRDVGKDGKFIDPNQNQTAQTAVINDLEHLQKMLQDALKIPSEFLKVGEEVLTPLGQGITVDDDAKISIKSDSAVITIETPVEKGPLTVEKASSDDKKTAISAADQPKKKSFPPSKKVPNKGKR